MKKPIDSKTKAKRHKWFASKCRERKHRREHKDRDFAKPEDKPTREDALPVVETIWD